MPTLADVRTRVDDWLAARWPTVVAKQESYFASNGEYWQGVITHTSYPAHLSATYGDSLPDRLLVTPTNISVTYVDAFPNWDGTLFPAALVVDVYDSPQGKGWMATVFAMFNGTIYSRTQSVGPETWRSVGWHVVPQISGIG